MNSTATAFRDVIAFSKQKKQSKCFLEFIEIFYSENDALDFSSYSIEALYDCALSSFESFKKRKKAKIRVYNLEKLQDLSFLEIINDDIPFLVDSVVAQLEHINLDIKNLI
jgi:glutamate dehydrogenase